MADIGVNLVVLTLWGLGLTATWSGERRIRTAGWTLMLLGLALLTFRTLAMVSDWLGG